MSRVLWQNRRMAVTTTTTEPPPDGGATPCCAPLSDSVITDSDAAEVAAKLKVLADPIRLRLVSMVANAPTGEVCACDLPEQLNRSQPTISHHLSQLVEAGILHREKRGKWAWFTLDASQLTALCAVLAPTKDCC